MSLLPRPPRGDDSGPEETSLAQGVLLEETRQRWIAGAARWRAGALAEAIFGGPVVPRLRYARAAAGFQALVELQVPFHGLADHRDAESRFLRAAERDEVLGRIPTLFVFTPDPGAREGGVR